MRRLRVSGVSWDFILLDKLYTGVHESKSFVYAVFI